MQTALEQIVSSNAFWDQSSMFLKSLLFLLSFALSLVIVVSSGAADLVVIEDWAVGVLGARGVPTDWAGQLWGVMFQFGIYPFFCRPAEFHLVHIEPEEEVGHAARTGKTERLASEALEPSAHRQVLALALLHRPLSYPVLLRRKMTPIDTRLVRVIMCETKGGEQGLEFQEHRILPGANDVRKHAPGVMINRLPQPPRLRFGTDETPHFLHRGGVFWQGADHA
jgi:hypothetical protein